MSIRVGINGLGRIGKGIVAAWVERNFANFDIVMINDKIEASSFAHLIKYDSIHGRLHAELRAEGDTIIIGENKKIKLTSCAEPSETPWGEMGVDIVLECTGKFTDRAKAAKHLQAGAKKVLVSAPSKDPDVTIVMGVNHQIYDPKKHDVISNASCTTNCLAPVAKVLNENFGIKHGLMTTIHSYTNDQKILDKFHKDLRRARAGALSMIPTTTGAAKSIGIVMPELAGKLDGLSIRVPTPNVSLVDLVVSTEKKPKKEDINNAFRMAAATTLNGILTCSEEPLVSIDFNGTWESAIVDTELTNALPDGLVKVLAWYDNETGFSHRMIELASYIAKHMK